jgi:hypothetical protein
VCAVGRQSMRHARTFMLGVLLHARHCGMWLSLALFPFAAAAQTYPVSGVWVAMDDQFPDSKAGACLALKMFGIDAASEGSLPTLMIFSESRRYEVRAGRHFERTIRSITNAPDGTFRIAESSEKHSKWLPWSKEPFYTLKIIDRLTIELIEGKVRTRLFKCSPGNPSL